MVNSFYDVCFVLAANNLVACLPVEADVLCDVCFLRPLMVNRLRAWFACKLMPMFNIRDVTCVQRISVGCAA